MSLALFGIQLQNLCTSYPSWNNVLSFHSSSFTAIPCLEGHGGMELNREGESRGETGWKDSRSLYVQTNVQCCSGLTVTVQ